MSSRTRRSGLSANLLAVAAALLASLPAGASGAPVLVPVARVQQPTVVTAAPGRPGLLFAAERRGRIRIIRKGEVTQGSFLDLTRLVTSTWLEQGLLGLTFDPGYRTSRRFYVDYVDQARNVVIAEYRTRRNNPYRADPASRRVLLVIPPVGDGYGHNGGMLRFQGGLLYISVGDGNNPGDAAGTAQNRESLRGKILRIDPRPGPGKRAYRIPPGNPLAGVPGRDEILAWGLRNPHSFSFYRPPGMPVHMVISDVGQARFEEINYLPLSAVAGANFGWKFYEGMAAYSCGEPLCPNGGTAPPPPDGPDPAALTWPALVYSHDSGCAVIGGPVVRDPGLPSLRGRMIYGDFCSDTLRSAVPAVPAMTGNLPLAATLPTPKGESPALNGFGTDARGRVYPFSNRGPVYRLVEQPAGTKQARREAKR